MRPSLNHPPPSTNLLFPVNTPFAYEKGELTCEATSLTEIATAVGTPFYVYSRAEILARARTLVETAQRVANGQALVCYAVKANANPALVRMLIEAGLGADVTSGGELFLARHAGAAPGKIVFSGVGKQSAEIAEAITWGVRAIHVESEMELAAVGEEAERLGIVASVGVRVNPNIDAATHPYISTGLHGHKFGVPRERAVAMLHFAASHSWLKPVGLAAHIGSQITDLAPFAESVRFLVALADEMKGSGITLEYVDAGGGLGIDYEQAAPDAAKWVRTIGSIISDASYGLVIEPGRSMVGPNGLTVYRVATVKRGVRTHVAVDGGMADNLEVSLYGQPFDPSIIDKTGRVEICDVVGRHCESGDTFVAGHELVEPEVGDLLVIPATGAYTFTMSNNYNGALRPPVVFCEDGRARVAVRRETYEELLGRDVRKSSS